MVACQETIRSHVIKAKVHGSRSTLTLILDALRKEVEQLLRGLRVDGGLWQVQTVFSRHILVVAVHQHHVVIDHFKVVDVLHQKVRKLLKVLARDVAHLWRCLTPMTHQTANGHLCADAVHQQLVLEVVLRLLNVVPLSACARVHPIWVRVIGNLVRVYVHVIAADEEQGRVASEEFLQACKE